MSPIHPGTVLNSVLNDAGLTANAAALALRIPANRLTAIINGQRGISADTAMRLGRFFGTSAEMWMNLQAKYDLHKAEDEFVGRVEREVQPFAVGSSGPGNKGTAQSDRCP
jgi:addiction module HigA family antidote